MARSTQDTREIERLQAEVIYWQDYALMNDEASRLLAERDEEIARLKAHIMKLSPDGEAAAAEITRLNTKVFLEQVVAQEKARREKELREALDKQEQLLHEWRQKAYEKHKMIYSAKNWLQLCEMEKQETYKIDYWKRVVREIEKRAEGR